MSYTIYHNPKCGTSRNTLAMLQEAGVNVDVVEYLKTPPNRDELLALIAKTGLSVRDVLRKKGTPYEELGLDDPKWNDDQLIDFIGEHPILMNRPIVVSGETAILSRPSEKVLEILPEASVKTFVKEDGEVVQGK